MLATGSVDPEIIFTARRRAWWLYFTHRLRSPVAQSAPSPPSPSISININGTPTLCCPSLGTCLLSSPPRSMWSFREITCFLHCAGQSMGMASKGKVRSWNFASGRLFLPPSCSGKGRWMGWVPEDMSCLRSWSDTCLALRKQFPSQSPSWGAVTDHDMVPCGGTLGLAPQHPPAPTLWIVIFT